MTSQMQRERERELVCVFFRNFAACRIVDYLKGHVLQGCWRRKPEKHINVKLTAKNKLRRIQKTKTKKTFIDSNIDTLFLKHARAVQSLGA
jgi:hypothetical protein